MQSSREANLNMFMSSPIHLIHVHDEGVYCLSFWQWWWRHHCCGQFSEGQRSPQRRDLFSGHIDERVAQGFQVTLWRKVLIVSIVTISDTSKRFSAKKFSGDYLHGEFNSAQCHFLTKLTKTMMSETLQNFPCRQHEIKVSSDTFFCCKLCPFCWATLTKCVERWTVNWF